MITFSDTSTYLVDIELSDPDGRQFMMHTRSFVIGSFDAEYYDEAVFSTYSTSYVINRLARHVGVAVGYERGFLVVGRTVAEMGTTQHSGALIVGGIRPRMDNLSFTAFVIENVPEEADIEAV